MKRLLFAPSMSLWQWLTMSAGLSAELCMGSGWGLLAFLGIVIFGAAIEGIVEAVFGL